jgi:hypothetical protein
MESVSDYLKSSQSPVYETFGFRTTKSPPPIKELDEFEGKIFNLRQNVKFRKYHNEFQNNLERDLTNKLLGLMTETNGSR